jgi:hypothetical protein
MITQLIDKRDNVEIIRDQIAAILCSEVTNQVKLAKAAHKPWLDRHLHIYTERSSPWDDFMSIPDGAKEQPDRLCPIVAVSFENTNYEKAGSDFERQRTVGIFNIDCYGYGVARDDGGNGHCPGDAQASLNAQRAVRLVRNLLMAAEYETLKMTGVVSRRWFQSVSMFQPQIDGRSVERVVAARMALEVTFNEYSPQVEGQPLELIAATLRRYETGQVYLVAQYP